MGADEHQSVSPNTPPLVPPPAAPASDAEPQPEAHEAPTLVTQAARADWHFDVAYRQAALVAATRASWAAMRRMRWDLFIRLAWRDPVSLTGAHEHLDAWMDRHRHWTPGLVGLLGLHTDTDRLHAHGLLYLPRRVRDGLPEDPMAGVLARLDMQHWLAWPFGEAWVAAFRPAEHRGGRGAAAYVSRNLETVTLYGTPIPYHPHRRRRR